MSSDLQDASDEHLAASPRERRLSTSEAGCGNLTSSPPQPSMINGMFITVPKVAGPKIEQAEMTGTTHGEEAIERTITLQRIYRYRAVPTDLWRGHPQQRQHLHRLRTSLFTIILFEAGYSRATAPDPSSTMVGPRCNAAATPVKLQTLDEETDSVVMPRGSCVQVRIGAFHLNRQVWSSDECAFK
ncbi:hypothetical protein C8Q76DRAFT_798187 [Earliella scabrosa]|nr:hypothetical protein C8Q76DRAFT_798187 [Earliella scabrosa]